MFTPSCVPLAKRLFHSSDGNLFFLLAFLFLRWEGEGGCFMLQKKGKNSKTVDFYLGFFSLSVVFFGLDIWSFVVE